MSLDGTEGGDGTGAPGGPPGQSEQPGAKAPQAAGVSRLGAGAGTLWVGALAALKASPAWAAFDALSAEELDELCSGPPSLPAPRGMRGSVGSGKTHRMIATIAVALAADPGIRIGVAVPNHKLSEEFAERLRKALPGVPVGIWRGTSQLDPDAPGQTICRRKDDVKAVVEAGGELADLCGSKGRGFCPHHPEVGGVCGYIAQGRTRPTVWVITHSMLAHPAPKPMRRDTATDKRRPAVDMLFIDESFFMSMLGDDDYVVTVADLSAGVFASVPDRLSDNKPRGWATKVLALRRSSTRTLLRRLSAGARIDKVDLAQMGLDEDRCQEAHKHALRCKVDLAPALRGSQPGAAAVGMGAAAADNRATLHVANFFRVAADVSAGRLGPGALAVIENEKTGVRGVRVRWRRDIHRHWAWAQHGIIHGDATMVPLIVEQFLRAAVIDAKAPMATPFVHILQVEDKVVGYGSIIPSPIKRPKGVATARTNAKDMRKLIDTASDRFAGGGDGKWDGLVVMPLDLEEHYHKMTAHKGAPPPVPVPANIGTLHFGKLRGVDAYRGVRVLVVLSRPMPPPHVVEDLADILFGVEVERLPWGEFYPMEDVQRIMQDGTTMSAKAYRHPDPRAEAVRWAACEAEIIQAIGRGRGIHRTAANPLNVIVVSNVPLDDVPMTEVCTMSALLDDFAGRSALLEMLKAGVLPSSWSGIGAVLKARGWFSAKAVNHGATARHWFSREHDEMAALTEARRVLATAKGVQTLYAAAGASGPGMVPLNAAGLPPGTHSNGGVAPGAGGISAVPGRPSAKGAQIPYRNPLLTIGDLSTFRAGGVWPRFTYRQKGSRKASTVLISPAHFDPRAAAEAMLGPFDAFSPATLTKRGREAAAKAAIAGPNPGDGLPAPDRGPRARHRQGNAPGRGPATGAQPYPVSRACRSSPATGVGGPTHDPYPGAELPKAPPLETVFRSAALLQDRDVSRPGPWAPPQVVHPPGRATPGPQPHTPLDALLEARIASVLLGLPPVLDALVRDGHLTPAERRQHMVQFRAGRGSHDERERKALARLVLRLGAAALAAAARAAGMAKLGLTAQSHNVITETTL